MNRELLESLYKARGVSKHLEDFCARAPEVMTLEPLAPEFILQEKLEFGEDRDLSESLKDQSLGCSDTLTFISSSSNLDSFKELYKNVYVKRSSHSPFAELSRQSFEAQKWLYIDEKTEQTFGPFFPADMDQRFKWGILKEKTQVKLQGEACFNVLAGYIKKYVCMIMNNKGSVRSRHEGFDNYFGRHSTCEELDPMDAPQDVYQRRTREDRVVSNIVKPNLDLLRSYMNDQGDDELAERVNRNRASTHKPFTRPF